MDGAEEPLPDLSAMTVAELKKFAADKGYHLMFKKGNKKADLIEAITEEYNSKAVQRRRLAALQNLGDDFQRRREALDKQRAYAAKQSEDAKKAIETANLKLEELESKPDKTIEDYQKMVKNYKILVSVLKISSAAETVAALTGLF